MASATHENITCSISSYAEGFFKAVGHQGNREDDNNESHLTLKNLVSLLDNGSTLFHSFDADRLVVLNLNNCPLGDVPKVFQRLRLKELHLSNVGLEEIPVCFYSGFDGLEVLDISSNKLKSFDIEPKFHATLKRLNLKNNKIKNLPLWIRSSRAQQLQVLDYSYNIIADLTCLHNKYDLELRTIIMRNCTLRDEDLRFFKNIATLEKLDMSNEETVLRLSNKFADLDQLFIKAKWRRMTELNFSNMSLCIVPEGVVWVRTLVTLELSKNYISWLPNDMELLVNLEIIDVSDNELSFLPSGFFMLRNLRIIKAANNILDSFQDVSVMESLEILDLYNNRLEEFCDLPKGVKMLDFELNLKDTKEYVQYNSYIQKRDDYRKILMRARCEGPTERPPESIPEEDYCPSLEDTLEVDDDELVVVEAEEEDWDAPYGKCEPEKTEEEDWDAPYKKLEPEITQEDWDCPHAHKKCEPDPDVTLSDNEWNGEIPYRSREVITSGKQTRVYNEDWMFCDVEDDE